MAVTTVMKLTLFRTFVFIAAALALAIVGAVVFRTELAEIGLRAALRNLGFDNPTLRVVAVNLDRVVVENVVLNVDRALAAQRITADFTLDQLWQGRLGRVDVHGLRLRAEAGTEGFAIDGLPLGSGAETAGPPQVPLDTLVLHDAAVAVRTLFGEIDLKLDGTVRADTTPIAATLGFTVSAAEGFATGRADLKITPENDLDVTLRVSRGSLQLALLQARDIAGRLELSLRSGQIAAAHARLDAGDAATTATGGPSGELHIEADYAPDGGRAMLLFAEAADQATVWVDLTVGDPLTAPQWELASVVELTADSGLWQVMALPPPTAGQASIELESRGAIAASDLVLGAGVADILATVQGAAEFVIRVDDADHPVIGRGLHADVAATIVAERGGLTFMLQREAAAGAASIARSLLQTFGPSKFVQAELAKSLTLGLRGSPEQPFKIFIQPTAAGFDVAVAATLAAGLAGGPALEAQVTGNVALAGDSRVRKFDLPEIRLALHGPRVLGAVDPRLRATGNISGTPTHVTGRADFDADVGAIEFGGVSATAISLRAPVRVETHGVGPDRTLSLRLDAPGRLTASDVVLPGGVRFDQTVQLVLESVEPGLVQWKLAAREPQSIEHALAVRAPDVSLRVPIGNHESHRIHAREAAITYRGRFAPAAGFSGSADLAIAEIGVPDFAIIAESVAGTVAIDNPNRNLVGALTIDAVGHTASAPWFVPLALTADVTLVDQVLEGRAIAHERADGAERLIARGRYSLRNEGGTATVELVRTAFVVGGRQPADLIPRLDVLQAVDGEITGELRANVGLDGLQTSASVRASGLSFSVAGTTVRNLNTDFELISLTPLATAVPQTVTIGAIDSVTSIADAELRLSLHSTPSSDPTTLAVVERAQASILGGNLSIAETQIWPRANPLELLVEMSRIDLAQLLALTEIEDVDGTGSLSGFIPLVLADGTPGIRGGKLASDGGGTLRLRSDKVSDLIGQDSGEQVSLVVRALRDFRYDTLTMEIDKEVAGDGTVGLHLLGFNPAVLDGHPLKFNVNMSINFDEILTAILAAYGRSTGAVRRALGLPGPASE